MKMWIARGKYGYLRLFDSKPKLDENGTGWVCKGGSALYLLPFKFPEVTFENSPVEYELKLKEK